MVAQVTMYVRLSLCVCVCSRYQFHAEDGILNQLGQRYSIFDVPIPKPFYYHQ